MAGRASGGKFGLLSRQREKKGVEARQRTWQNRDQINVLGPSPLAAIARVHAVPTLPPGVGHEKLTTVSLLYKIVARGLAFYPSVAAVFHYLVCFLLAGCWSLTAPPTLLFLFYFIYIFFYFLECVRVSFHPGRKARHSTAHSDDGRAEGGKVWPEGWTRENREEKTVRRRREKINGRR